jgi:hypothetical protein
MKQVASPLNPWIDWCGIGAGHFFTFLATVLADVLAKQQIGSFV